MKKIVFALMAFAGMLMTSCSNDEIKIEADQKVNEVSVSVTLSNFFSNYNFVDTKHGIDQLAGEFRVFNSEYKKKILVRTLFYDKQGNLADSLITYATSTNAVTKSINLAAGEYTAITTLTFADSSDKGGESWWELAEKESLANVHLDMINNFSKWSIMSYDAQEIYVNSNAKNSIDVNPKPLGAIGYCYYQNFQYKDITTYPIMGDNGIRAITIYTQTKCEGIKLDPNSRDRYIYKKATGKDSWYFLSSQSKPSDYDESWTSFQSNLYDYFYILAPTAEICFGYIPEGKTSFTAYGRQTYSDLQSGTTYLAYWDWFQVGNPYFGVADNNHWNDYSSLSSKGLIAAPQTKEPALAPMFKDVK